MPLVVSGTRPERSTIRISAREKKIFSSPKTSRQSLKTLSLLFNFFSGFSGVKWQRLETDHSPPFTADIQIDYSYNSCLPVRFDGLYRDKFTFASFEYWPNQLHVVLAEVFLLIYSISVNEFRQTDSG